VTNRVGVLIALGALLFGGCAGGAKDSVSPATIPADMRRITFEVVARNGRCEPSVLAADREGRSLLITFQVTSRERPHYFLLPRAGIRTEVPAGATVEIPWVAERSEILEYACASGRWILPLTPTGKLAIK
jgi:hypothetical protein